MHEQSIVESLLSLALETAENANAIKIRGIYLVVGDLTGVVEEAVDFYFNFLSKNTIASGANLYYTRVPAQLHCRNCDTTFTPERLKFQCPNCSEQRLEIIAGKELYIESIDVE